MKEGKNNLSTLKKDIIIPVGNVEISGVLSLPKDAQGIVIFAHSSDGVNPNSRNTEVIKVLEDAGLATLLLDLLTLEEKADRTNIFDIDLLTNRLCKVTEWVRKNEKIGKLPVGYLGAGTGAGAALQAATLAEKINAVVSHSGRPDLVVDCLPKVSSPTLLIVGGEDEEVLALNKAAFERLGGIKKLAAVLGATHNFEEPGTFEQVGVLVRDWFAKYLFLASFCCLIA